ncbi:hypothetical protein RPE78_07965 [Thioclava litoralis]|uniref:Uncharacterized protein n=1 Tax=Thioclava litoralis TaxID=3076557 RepID=A0ABZ1DVZ7_9RHOB|nr:hypothetical protein RPE78_07965 [Thioclava sp. FTW29]
MALTNGRLYAARSTLCWTVVPPHPNPAAVTRKTGHWRLERLMRLLALPLIGTLALAACMPPGSAKPDAGNVAAAGPIPAGFQGRWGMSLNDCTSTKGDAKGLMTVSADTLTFYESRGVLTEPQEQSATKLAGLFDFTGEGQSWSYHEILELKDKGQTVIRTETGDGAAPAPLRYTRCPI